MKALLTSVPVEESFSSEHSSELFTDTLEEFLDGGGVANERRGHLQSTWRNVANRGLKMNNKKTITMTE